MTPAPAPSAEAWKGLEFSLGGIPVLIRPAFFLIAVVLGASSGSADKVAIWVGIVFVSVLIHELGHAAAMRAFGFTPTIELHSMGGVTRSGAQVAASPGREIVITACGPGAGLLLGGVLTLVLLQLGPDAHPSLRWALVMGQFVNIAWSLVNLLPVLPWDGGLILDSAVEGIAKRPRPKIAAVVSLVVGAAVVVYGLYETQIMLIYFGGVGVWQGYARLNPKKPEDDQSQRVWALMQEQKFADAERLANQELVSIADPTRRAGLYEAIAWSRLLRDDWRGTQMAIEKMDGVKPSRHLAATIAAHEGRHADVVSLLTPLPSSPSELALRTEALIALKRTEQVITDACNLLARPDLAERRRVLLLSSRLFETGAWEPSLQVSLTAFDALGEPVHLFNAACAQVKLGQLDAALATLGRAIEAGYGDRQQVLDDPDLAPLRSLAGWQKILGS